jgi:hypothetical protein
MRPASPLPVVFLGAAGAFAIVSIMRARRAAAATGGAHAPRAPEAGPRAWFDLGRPVADDVRAVVSSGWSAPRPGRLHRALDIRLPTGTPILAVDDGVVVRTVHVDRSDAGLWVGVRHASGLTTRYLHLSRVLVDVGQAVRRGEPIGLSGNTGNSSTPHLHIDLSVPTAMLPPIEEMIGKPRSGWGARVAPYGHRIPGEPFVAVDGYLDRVRLAAAKDGIPLRERRNAALGYRPVGNRGEPYPDWLRRLRGASGVYVIRERDRGGDPVIVYVGSSSAGRLYETLTRHLQTWRRWKGFWRGQYGEGHDPGLTYDRDRVEVAVRVTTPSRALDEEMRLIRRLRPRDNLIGQDQEEVIPF